MEILIRFNHNATSEDNRWRILIDEVEHQCANIEILCPSKTCKAQVWNIREGKYEDKWHISPISPSKVIFRITENTIEVQ